jgi:hypothetical protein
MAASELVFLFVARFKSFPKVQYIRGRKLLFFAYVSFSLLGGGGWCSFVWRLEEKQEERVGPIAANVFSCCCLGRSC